MSPLAVLLLSLGQDSTNLLQTEIPAYGPSSFAFHLLARIADRDQWKRPWWAVRSYPAAGGKLLCREG